MSTRRLAGSRRNKHLPIARRTTRNDRLPQLAEEASIRWLAARDGMGAVIAALFHNSAQRSKPDHAARAVSIATCFPPLDVDGRTSAMRRKAAEAGARGKSAAPMSRQRRIDAYQQHNVLTGDRRMSERQFRQLQRMNIRAAFATA